MNWALSMKGLIRVFAIHRQLENVLVKTENVPHKMENVLLEDLKKRERFTEEGERSTQKLAFVWHPIT